MYKNIVQKDMNKFLKGKIACQQKCQNKILKRAS